MANILITGATGFIGKRLVEELLLKEDTLYALVRTPGFEEQVSKDPNVHFIYGDLLHPLKPFPKNLDAAFYLVHSLGKESDSLLLEETTQAKNFLAALEKTDCRQVIFLGGIIENESSLSDHLKSRLAVEKTLQKGKIPCTILRASIIIGSGSASFEIIRDLVEKLPYMVAPKWVSSECQPISILDVLYYLSEVVLKPECYDQTFDIGGPESLTFKQMLLRYASFRNMRRFIIEVPVLTPKLSSYWLVFITSVKFSICQHLVESMRQNTRKLNQAIDAVLPHRCLNLEESLQLCFQPIKQNALVSTWMDAWHPTKRAFKEAIEVPSEGCLKDVQKVPLMISKEEVIKRIWSIGGKSGWYSMNWAWKLRGLMDKLVGGIGLNRGRNDPFRLKVGDPIDFWRVILADEKMGRLILYATMKLPGEAWLEFCIHEKENTLEQIATFRPKGVFGRLYWYLLFPFHWIIFKNMARAIAQKTNK